MRLRCQNGATTVEFAIVLPLFLMIVFGVMQFGLLLNNYVMLNNAAVLGARVLAKERGYPTPYTDTQNQILASMQTMSQTATIKMYVGGTLCSSDSACIALLGNSSTQPPPNTQAKVSLSYNFMPSIMPTTQDSAYGFTMPSQLNSSSSEFVE
jgi:Flp pilus assembly protein TadG